ncbi:hypothetical protein RF11_15885 [Thelohanellus kitauei]|uniref:Uncharacterized protein n=1 Tax=Thelohanellus kitauei TaxID=669202 RepID=A0A0C2ITE5_THEKT|nr:hypothetical protein RF11_15885 [Thelohanellus kitauei]
MSELSTCVELTVLRPLRCKEARVSVKPIHIEALDSPAALNGLCVNAFTGDQFSNFTTDIEFHIAWRMLHLLTGDILDILGLSKNPKANGTSSKRNKSPFNLQFLMLCAHNSSVTCLPKVVEPNKRTKGKTKKKCCKPINTKRSDNTKKSFGEIFLTRNELNLQAIEHEKSATYVLGEVKNGGCGGSRPAICFLNENNILENFSDLTTHDQVCEIYRLKKPNLHHQVDPLSGDKHQQRLTAYDTDFNSKLHNRDGTKPNASAASTVRCIAMNQGMLHLIADQLNVSAFSGHVQIMTQRL